MKRFVALLLLATVMSTGVLSARQGGVMLGVKGGHNATFGGFGAFSIEGNYSAVKHFAVRGGVEYNTISRVAVELQPAYFHDFNFGRLYGLLLFDYVNQSNINNYAAGLGAALDTKYIGVKLGYYYRAMRVSGDTLTEPFNICYQLAVHCLPNRKSWDLDVIFSNCRPFELERHYQPSLAVEGWWYPLERMGVKLGVNYKPSGTFHLSSDYYQIYANIGVCYRW